MKKLAILLVLVVALYGCGRESERIDADAMQAKDDAHTLTIAWHKVTEDDGSICDLSASTQETVEQASEELRRALAPNGMEIVVETLTPEKAEGGDCLCNRVLIQGRFVDEWLGAEVVKTSCSGCPGRAECPKGSASGGPATCDGQTAIMYQGKTYEIIPASLIAMAGVVAAAELTGEPITYNSCPGHCGCNGACTCGKCEDGCRFHGTCTCGQCESGCRLHGTDGSAAVCPADCPGRTANCAMACGGHPGSCGGHCANTAPAGAKTSGPPHASQCKGNTCPVAGH